MDADRGGRTHRREAWLQVDHCPGQSAPSHSAAPASDSELAAAEPAAEPEPERQPHVAVVLLLLLAFVAAPASSAPPPRPPRRHPHRQTDLLRLHRLPLNRCPRFRPIRRHSPIGTRWRWRWHRRRWRWRRLRRQQQAQQQPQPPLIGCIKQTGTSQQAGAFQQTAGGGLHRRLGRCTSSGGRRIFASLGGHRMRRVGRGCCCAAAGAAFGEGPDAAAAALAAAAAAGAAAPPPSPPPLPAISSDSIIVFGRYPSSRLCALLLAVFLEKLDSRVTHEPILQYRTSYLCSGSRTDELLLVD